MGRETTQPRTRNSGLDMSGTQPEARGQRSTAQLERTPRTQEEKGYHRNPPRLSEKHHSGARNGLLMGKR